MGISPLAATPEIGKVLDRAAGNLRKQFDSRTEEIMRAVEAGIPEYARPADEMYRRTLRAGVEQGLYGFVAMLERDTSTSWRDVYRVIGAGEMYEGRSLDALQAAIRIGARTGLRHLVAFAEREALTAATIGSLVDAIWSHVDGLAEAAAEGYAVARAAEAGELDRRRRRLLDLLVADPPVSEETIAAAAHAARWPMPQRLAAVALEPEPVHTAPPVLAPDVLAGLDQARPVLILPDPDSPAQARVINGLHRYRLAVGPAVPPSEAANSLRWARQALDLGRRGIIATDGPLWCDEHLAELTIFQDEALLRSVIQRRLRPLAAVRRSQREPLAETLLCWLQHNMNANAVAASLHVHPQTVRRRLRQLDELFGDQVHASDSRFELEIALRAERATRIAAARKATLDESPRLSGPTVAG